MTKTERAALIAYIDANTAYDTTTIRFHQDGTVSAIEDADKTFNAPETVRLLVGHVDDLRADMAA